MKKIMLLKSLLMASMLIAPIFAEAGSESIYFMMQGLVTSYGGNTAFGWCGTYGEVGEWAVALVAWAPGIPPTPPEEPPTNFTYSFYAANLTNALQVELNYSGADLYISGLWNVYNITFAYEITENSFTYNLTIKPVVEAGEGTLVVTGNWAVFTVAIIGIDEVSGIVLHHCVKSEEAIPIGDISGISGVPDNNIDIFDLVHTAKAYGTTPGIEGYEFSIDFNFDFTIDIYDLTTIAVNLGEHY